MKSKEKALKAGKWETTRKPHNLNESTSFEELSMYLFYVNGTKSIPTLHSLNENLKIPFNATFPL